MLDLVSIGETMIAFTPYEKGKLRYINDYRTKIAGAESNIAIGLSKLGLKTGWISRLGNDEFGSRIINTIRGEGVDVSNVTFDEIRPTGIMIKEFTTNNETRIHYYRSNSAASRIEIDNINKEYLANAKIIHITGITPLLSSEAKHTILNVVQFAKERNILISYDPNIRMKLFNPDDHLDILKYIAESSDILLMGISEAEILYGTSELKEIVKRIFNTPNSNKILALKNGDQGAYVSDGEVLFNIPPHPCNPIDPTGAGDAFNAGFIYGFLNKKDLATCGKYASICGALATESFGDFESLPSTLDLHNIIEHTSVCIR